MILHISAQKEYLIIGDAQKFGYDSSIANLMKWK